MADAGADPPDGGERLSLSATELRLLKALRATALELRDEDSIGSDLGLPGDVLRGSLQRLRSKRLLVVDEEHLEHRGLTPRGETALRAGLPERRLLRLLADSPEGVPADRLQGEAWSGEERSAAIGQLRRGGWLAEGSPLRLKPGAPVPDALPEEQVLRQLHDGVPVTNGPVFDQLKRRGLVRIDRETVRRWGPSAEGRELAIPEDDRPQLGALTAEMLRSGAWRSGSFRPYDVLAEVPYRPSPRPHPYLQWLREFEEILVGLGFQQSEGPLLETEFWNADALFMPQEHPARSIHDALSIEGVTTHLPDPALVDRVAAAHEGRPLAPGTPPISPGWRTPYDRAIARRPVLRSQTTSVSARFLARKPTPPFRMYCLDRNLRRDAVDATHHVEFRQCEGIVGGEEVSLRSLVGVFRSLAEAIGIREVKIRPSYFPFTEPSIEGYVRHPHLGWIEVLPGGMFRPEVLRPLGIDVPVAAWGIGVTRLAMVALGVNDIRELFEDDLERLTGGGS